MADFGARFGFTFPSLDGLDIAETLNPLVHVSNPFDYHTFDWGDAGALLPAFTKVLQGPQDMSLFVLDFPKPGTGDASGFEIAIDCMAQATEQTGKRAAVLSTYPENMPEPLATQITDRGLIPLCGLQAGMEGLAAAALPPKGPYQYLPAPTGPRQQLDEVTAKADLQAAGMDVPKGQLLSQPPSPSASGPLTRPVVMKAVSADLAHKSEVGGVMINVQDPAAAYAKLRSISPNVLMEEMVQDALGELILGYVIDPVVGGHMVIGAGGILTELLADSAIVLLPFTKLEALTALKELKMARVLQGYRGKPAADMDIIAEALMTMQRRLMAGDIHELDINPLMITSTRAVVADALMVLEQPI